MFAIPRTALMLRYAVLAFCAAFVLRPDLLMAQPCAVAPTPEEQAFMKVHRTKARGYSLGETRGIRDFPVKLHVVTRDNGGGGCDITTVKRAIETLNANYINANVRFVLLDDVDYIKSSNYYNFDTQEEEALCTPNDSRGVINLYTVGEIRLSGTELCGYAYFPNAFSSTMKKDRVLMQNTCINDGCTMPHEMGHYFSLYHTHGKSNFGTTDELADESNCGSAGDELCDTPADPGLYGKVDRSCHYTGAEHDPKGTLFHPDPSNMMSYASSRCTKLFTPEQYARMNYAAFNLRSYLAFPDGNKQAGSGTSTTAQAGSNTDAKKTTNSTESKEIYIGELSGELELKIQQQTVPTRLDGNLYKGTKSYYSGTPYQVLVDNNQPAYVYVIGADLTNKTSVLFPQAGQKPYIEDTSYKILLPSQNQRYVMDNTKGKDYLCVLYSRSELSVKDLTRKMQGTSGTFTQRLYRALGAQLVPSNQITYATDGRLAFNALTYGDEAVVPIIVELKHQ